MSLFTNRYCQLHRSGVPVDAPKFFVEGCLRCEEKKAAGLVNGTEGPLPLGWRRKAAPRIDWQRLKRQTAARKKATPLEIQAPKTYR